MDENIYNNNPGLAKVSDINNIGSRRVMEKSDLKLDKEIDFNNRKFFLLSINKPK